MMNNLFWDTENGGYFEGPVSDTDVLLRMKNGFLVLIIIN